MLKETVLIKKESGLHARPAATLVRIASKYTSEITIVKDSMEINGKSILGVMTLAAEKGSSIMIIVDGEDEKEAMAKLVTFLNEPEEETL